ncbi:MAG: divergent polysaccharide deacetylase family protein [Asticcacaulis sp.]|nr:divergent polysaccharide deacetylase family protein [Asticcacaulis sp.]
MFAKPKSPAFTRRSAAGAGSFDPRALFDKVVEALKKPYVAPATAGGAFICVLIAFLALAGDPDAGSPSVRVNLNKPKTASGPTTHVATDGNTSGMQDFTLDSLGMFSDASADAFNLDASGQPIEGTATITIPGDDSDVTSGAPAVRAPASPLAKAPITGLIQPTGNGPMPVIAPNGMTPSSAYARPFKSDGRPFVALIVGGLGLNPATTRQAIEQLPPEVTLSFVPYTSGLQGWIDQARAAGHEVMIEVPMQPSNYPDNDPGPQTLMANAKVDDLQAHITWALSRATGYFAVSNYQGGAFLKDRAGSATFLDVLKSRGVAFIDDGQARSLNGAWARASADRVVDSQINATAITAQLAGLESTAKSRGSALGTGFAYPVTLAVAMRWTQSLDAKGIQLAPASAVTHQ